MARGITTPHRTDTSVGAASGTVALAWYAILATLEAAGWVVTRDSDGTTYSSSGTQLTGGGSGAGGLGNVNAWFVVRSPDSGHYFCVQMIALATSTATIRVKYSTNAFSGGSPSATQVPSAVGEVLIRGGGTDASPTGQRGWSDGTAGTHRCIGVADASAPYGFWFTHKRTDSSTDKDEFIFAFDPVEVVEANHSGDTDPYVIQLSAGTGNALTQAKLGAISFLLGTNEPGIGRGHSGTYTYFMLASYQQASGTTCQIGGTTGIIDGWTNKDSILPCFYYNAVSGYKGRSTLFWVTTAPDTNTLKLELFTTTAETREFMRNGRYAMPWGGAVPASGAWSTLNADVETLGGASVDTTAPTIGSPTPSVGAITNTSTIAFDVTDNLGELARVFVWMTDQTDPEVPSRLIASFDGSVWSFLGGFEDSGDSPISNGFTITVDPNNGWGTDSFDLEIFAVDEDGNSATATYSYTTDFARTITAQIVESDSFVSDVTVSQPPSVGSFSPTPGNLHATQAITFVVSDDVELSLVSIYASFTYKNQEYCEVVYAGGTFRGHYQDTNYNFVTTSTTSYSFSIRRDGGWLASPEIEFEIRDNLLNEANV